MQDCTDPIYIFIEPTKLCSRIMTNKEGTKLKADDNDCQRHLIGPQPQEACQAVATQQEPRG